MKLSILLMTPWRAMQGSSRWVVLAVVVASLGSSMPLHFFASDPHAWLIATVLYGFGAGFLFLMFSSVLPLAMDARRLRMPGIERATVMSLLLYAALAIAVPMIVLSPRPEMASTVALLVALVIAGVLAFVLLPRYLSIPMCLIPYAGIKLWREAHLPMPGHPGFLGSGFAILIVLVSADVFCWWRLLSGRRTHHTGLRGASVMMLHRNTRTNDWSGLAQQTDSRFIRQRPDWLQMQPDLHGVGPAQPVRALRIALGGWYMPQTWTSHARQILPSILVMLVFMVPAVSLNPDIGLIAVWHDVGLAGFMGVAILVTTILVALMPFALQPRWQRVNAELPLLALLPGLGDVATARRHLLRAALGKPLGAAALSLVVVLGIGLAMHLAGLTLLLLVIPMLACAGVGISTVLCIFGDKPLPVWATLALLSITLSVICFGTILPLMAVGGYTGLLAAGEITALVWSWFGLGVLLLWLGLRGWRGLQRRPHPFLANSP